MKKYVFPICLNFIFVIFIPYFMNLFHTNLVIQATYISIGVALYFFISSNILSAKENYNYLLILIGGFFAFLSMKILLTDVLFLYIALDCLMIFLGIRVGSIKRKVLEMKKPTNES